jgi:hypothetical protein
MHWQANLHLIGCDVQNCFPKRRDGILVYESRPVEMEYVKKRRNVGVAAYASTLAGEAARCPKCYRMKLYSTVIKARNPSKSSSCHRKLLEYDETRMGSDAASTACSNHRQCILLCITTTSRDNFTHGDHTRWMSRYVVRVHEVQREETIFTVHSCTHATPVGNCLVCVSSAIWNHKTFSSFYAFSIILSTFPTAPVTRLLNAARRMP